MAEGDPIKAALAQARKLVTSLEELAKGKPGDPFQALLAAKVTAYLLRVGEARTTRQVAQAVALDVSRSAKTIEQAHLPKLAELGFPHCHAQGKRRMWQYDKHRIQDKGA